MESKYLIIGQGIAGTLIAHECLGRCLPFHVLTSSTLSSASHIAAGIINPITGRKYVKTWMYETLETSLQEVYSDIGELLGNRYLYSKKIIRAIPSVADQNNWDARSLQDDAAMYMDSEVDYSDFHGKVKENYSYGNVQGYQLEIGELVSDYRSYLQEQGLLSESDFDHKQLEVSESNITYNGVEYSDIIFCEGYHVSNNPFFSYLPFRPAKGEVLILEIPGLKTGFILKDQLFFVPLNQEGHFWVGATYAWDNLDHHPTQEKKTYLLESVERLLTTPYTIVNHIAGIRPATKFRRPLIGTHPEYNNLHIFNGLGTKGSSLGPYWAGHFMDYILNDMPLSQDVDIRRLTVEK